ncbi:MAG: L,D-transpeptidase family protein [Clostridiales bacterium]|nr:L,D-transpeptidase family protein [Clostridiales bacterium]
MKRLASCLCILGLCISLAACTPAETEITSSMTGNMQTEIAVETSDTETSTSATTVTSQTETKLTESETVTSDTEETSEESETAEGEDETVTETTEADNLSPKWVRSLPEARDKAVDQLIVVAASGMNSSDCIVSMHERNSDGDWVQLFSVTGYVGVDGMVYDEDRYEGCGRTPIGTYTFTKAFGIAPDPGCAIPYIELTDDLYWSGDYNEHYNQMVSINDYPDLDTSNSEHLVDYDPAYQYCLNIGFNRECAAGRGSAIFLHCFGNNPYTMGCVAVSEDTMVEILQRVEPNCVIVIDTVSSLGAG